MNSKIEEINRALPQGYKLAFIDDENDSLYRHFSDILFSEIKFDHSGLIISLFVIIFILPCLILKREKGAS